MSPYRKTVDRRAFLKLAGVATAGAALPLVSPAIGLARLDKRLVAAQETRMLMGTLVSVTVLDPSPTRAQQALADAFARMASLTPLFDRHSSSGAVYLLNREGRLADAPPLLSRLLALCQRAGEITGGAFDIGVAPLIDLTRQSFAASGRPPARAQLQNALRRLGRVNLSQGRVRLVGQGAAITLDGVAKGFIVDQGMEAVRRAGARHAMINAGGDLAVMGRPGAGRTWRVGVADPQHPTRAGHTLSLRSGALATSGNYQVFFDRQRLYHHIVDPHTGRSPRSDLSASVRAPSALWADAMSTACFVMKPRQAARFLKSRPELEGMILTRHGQRYQSQGFG